MRKVVVLALFVLLVPIVGAVVVTNTEDFESLADGSIPSTDFGAFVVQNSVATVETNSRGNPTGAKSLKVDATTDTGDFVSLTLDAPGFPTSLSVWVDPAASSAILVNFRWGDGGFAGDIARLTVFSSGRVDLTGGATLEPVGTCTDFPLKITWDNFDFSTDMVDITINEESGATCHSSTQANGNTGVDTVYQFIIAVGDPAHPPYYVDDIRFQVENLEAPEGLRGTLYQIDGATDRLFIEVATSPDDTDSTGAFEYTLERDDGLGGGFSSVATLTAGTAVNGVFVVQDSYSGASDSLTYRAITESRSEYSCTITVELSLVGNTDVCGSLGLTVTEGGALFGSSGIFFFGDKAAFAEALNLEVAGAEALVGILLVLVLMAAGFQAIRVPEILQKRREKEEGVMFTESMFGGSVSYARYGALAGTSVGWLLAIIFSLLPFWTGLLVGVVLFGVKTSGLDFGSLPQKIFMIVLFTITFEGVMFGAEIAERSIPTFEEPSSTGFFAVLEGALAVIKLIWGGLLFVLNLLTFGLPDVPWFVRIPVGGTIASATVWSIIGMARGSSND